MRFGAASTLIVTAAWACIPTVFGACIYTIFDKQDHWYDRKLILTHGDSGFVIESKIEGTVYKLKFHGLPWHCRFFASTPPLPEGWAAEGYMAVSDQLTRYEYGKTVDWSVLEEIRN